MVLARRRTWRTRLWLWAAGALGAGCPRRHVSAFVLAPAQPALLVHRPSALERSWVTTGPLAADGKRKKRRQSTKRKRAVPAAPPVEEQPAGDAAAPADIAVDAAGTLAAPDAATKKTAAAPDLDVESLIVDEPGKLFGAPIEDIVKKKRPSPKRAPPEAPAIGDALKRGVDSLGGTKPEDPSDAFDYGLGGLIKQTVFVLSAALILFDLYLNSPLFERRAPPPIVTAVTEEISKYSGGTAPPIVDDQTPP